MTQKQILRTLQSELQDKFNALEEQIINLQKEMEIVTLQLHTIQILADNK